jgi:hypothetical protein
MPPGLVFGSEPCPSIQGDVLLGLLARAEQRFDTPLCSSAHRLRTFGIGQHVEQSCSQVFYAAGRHD